jgi:hypothetical protein
MYQRIQIYQIWRSITYSWCRIESFLQFRTERVPAPVEDLYQKSKVAPRHPNRPVTALLFSPLLYFPLNRDQLIASYSITPILMVWAMSDIILSLVVARLWQTPGLHLRPCTHLNGLISKTFPPGIVFQTHTVQSTKHIQGIHKRMVRFKFFSLLKPHHCFVYTLYTQSYN